ncbi:MAG TPA: DoxX family membrane protein [Polyangiales bacterium]|nr:DoxX family membrane protein [Polyangiales bacterium]
MKTARHATSIARSILGLMFVVFGANFFLHFLPQPPLEGPAGDFAAALFKSGYVMQTVKVVEVAAGLLLLTNRFVPLALTLLAPIVVGIVGFHGSLAPATGGAAYLALVLELFLAYAYRSAYAPLFESRRAPTLGTAGSARSDRAPAGELRHSTT